jgi:hypothetical protein
MIMPARSIPHAALPALAVASLGMLEALGCAASGAPSARAPLPGTDACVFIRNVGDWQVIDQTTMMVYAPLRKDAYLLKLFEPVPELDFHERVGFEDTAHNGQLCGGDYLLIRDEIAPRRVPIVAFRKLTPDEAKQLLSASKSAAKPVDHSAPAQPSAGKN